MKTDQLLQLLSCVALATAMPTGKLRAREVPQEHSHEQFLTTVRASLNTNNPAGILDPVFGLLGNAAAAGGKGSITDVECLQQATADQAFTNAKAAGSIDGMVGALVYRALERNTPGVGTKSNPCTSIKAVNPEIAALSQHQDPASTGAAAANKAVALALAVQIASVGGDPQIAIKSGTFAPGSLTDNTGKGNTCDDANDPVGCIFTQNLLVPDVTADEITAAVGSGSASGSDTTTAATSAAAAPPATSTTTAAAVECTPAPAGTTAAAAPASTSAAATSATADNLQTFTGALGASADSITFSGDSTRPFLVNGNTFVNFAAAAQRTCDIQFNVCANAANSGAAFSVGDCQTQKDQCDAAQTSATIKSFGSTAAAPPAAGSTSTAPTATTGTSDFGSCANANPDIVFGPGFDGRNTDSFEPADKTNFNHGSALNIAVISGFICQQLSDKCKASATVLAACASGSAAASKVTGQAAADAFNAAF